MATSYMPFGDPICDPHSFWEEARYQSVCAMCEKPGEFHAHHVVDKQTLRNRCGIPKKDKRLYDTRNALRLCAGLDGDQCHMQFENERIEIPTSKLTDDNIRYAFEKLGVWAADYLRQEYDDSTPDPRIFELEFLDEQPAA
jgi:hypothetical protein